MRIVVGILLILIAFFSKLFFRHYEGTIVPYPAFWMILSFILGFLGLWLLVTSLIGSRTEMENATKVEEEKFKRKAKNIELNIDKCEFKRGSFSHQVDDESMDSVKLFVPNLSFIDTKRTENVVQSYLTFTEIINGETSKFISQSFPFDQTTLKFYVMNNNLSLYVDKLNKSKYLFELKR